MLTYVGKAAAAAAAAAESLQVREILEGKVQVALQVLNGVVKAILDVKVQVTVVTLQVCITAVVAAVAAVYHSIAWSVQ